MLLSKVNKEITETKPSSHLLTFVGVEISRKPWGGGGRGVKSTDVGDCE
jgi:hypothetical protein